MEAILSFDRSVMLFFQDSVRNGVLDQIMVFLSTIANCGAVWLVIGAVLASTKKYRKAGLYVILSVALCYVFNDLVIKPIMARPRPFLEIDTLSVLVSRPVSYSFPSGHACAGFAASYVLTKCFGKKGAPFFILAVLIAVSRPYVGVHYLTDVLVGAVVGLLGSMFLYRFVFPRIENAVGHSKSQR